MSNDKALERLNVEIGEAETNGDRAFLASIIAPTLAFRRADKATFDNRDEFLKKVKKSDPRDTVIKSVDVNGDRAVVACLVTVHSPGGDKTYHNLRLFVRLADDWKLLGWANEPV